MTDTLPPQFIPVEGVRNFRDFGGYRTASGRSVVKGRLFRSANYAAITDEGLKALEQIGLRIVIDLRRGPERQFSPSKFNHVPVEILSSHLGDGDGVTLPPHLQFIRDTDLTAAATHDHMLSSYRRIPWEPQHIALFSETFSRLAAGQGPVVIHCAAGKDRTGILCGLIKHALGVSADDIMTDYLLTNHVARDEAMLKDYARYMAEQFDKPVDPEAMRPMFGVHPSFLEEAWAKMAEIDGSINGYLLRIGVDDKVRAQLADHLLV